MFRTYFTEVTNITKTCLYNFSLNIYFMYNINIFEHIQDMCLLHYNIIQWDSEESQLTYEVRLPFFAYMNVQIQHVT